MNTQADHAELYDANCIRCPRLVAFRQTVAKRYPEYFCRPVPSLGKKTAALLIVGLAPGMHGANRTGRPFTGDYAGILLYRTLYEFGFANQPESNHAQDDLQLIDCRITNAVKCVPPDNKPINSEIKICNAFLRTELEALPQLRGIVALGHVAHQAVLRAYGLPLSRFSFAHQKQHLLPHGVTLFDSYHCSRYNTQTGRLTATAFRAVFRAARRHLQHV